jgi:hypothetical protein
MPKDDKNHVSEMKNWEDRVKKESAASKDWQKNWGEVFGDTVGAVTHEDKIRLLEEKIKK